MLKLFVSTEKDFEKIKNFYLEHKDGGIFAMTDDELMDYVKNGEVLYFCDREDGGEIVAVLRYSMRAKIPMKVLQIFKVQPDKYQNFSGPTDAAKTKFDLQTIEKILLDPRVTLCYGGGTLIHKKMRKQKIMQEVYLQYVRYISSLFKAASGRGREKIVYIFGLYHHLPYLWNEYVSVAYSELYTEIFQKAGGETMVECYTLSGSGATFYVFVNSLPVPLRSHL